MRRLLPWLYKQLALVVLFGLSVVFVLLGLALKQGFWSDLITNMAATSIYVLIAYFTYDAVKSFIDRESTKELQEYAEAYISPRILSLQLSLMNLLFNAEEFGNTSLLDTLHDVSLEELQSRLREKEFLGFTILQDSSEISRDIQELIENSFLLTRLDNEQLIALVKIKNHIERLWIELSSLDRFDRLKKPAPKNYRAVKGSEISSYNETLPNRRLLLDMIGKSKDGVVVAFGDFDPRLTNKELLSMYKLKESTVPDVAENFSELFELLSQWWTKHTKRGLVLRVR